MKKCLPFLFVVLFSVLILGNSVMISRAGATGDAVAAPSTTSRGVDSGFVDDNGNPISEADYQKMVEKSKENIVQRNPVGAAIVTVVIAAGVVGVVKFKRSKRKA